MRNRKKIGKRYILQVAIVGDPENSKTSVVETHHKAFKSRQVKSDKADAYALAEMLR